MSTTTTTRAAAAPGTRCLLLQLEPTPYILPRALYVLNDAELHTDLIWTFVNSSQDWGEDASIGNQQVLLDRRISRLARGARVARLMLSILRGRYTVAHLAGWGHWVVRLAILCCKLRGVPFSVESDTPLNRNLAGWRESLKRALYPVFLNWASKVIPGGSRQAELFRYYGVSDDKICISHMTVDTRKLRGVQTRLSELVRSEAGIRPDEIIALFVGRLVEQKGINILLQAFSKAATRNEKLRLVLLGDGPLRPQVERAASSSPGRVVHGGRMPQLEVVSWMRASDFLVLPSEHEPWGLVVNEAMTCGLPVVVSDACGCADDLVEPGRTGIVVPAGDSQALADAMVKLSRDPNTRREMGREALRKIEPWVIERQAETIRAALVAMSLNR